MCISGGRALKAGGQQVHHHQSLSVNQRIVNITPYPTLCTPGPTTFWSNVLDLGQSLFLSFQNLPFTCSQCLKYEIEPYEVANMQPFLTHRNGSFPWFNLMHLARSQAVMKSTCKIQAPQEWLEEAFDVC